jgi:hypothetical protein
MATLRANKSWCCQGSFSRPVSINSTTQTIVRNVQFTRPFHHRKCPSIIRQRMVGTAVQGLFCSARPSTVLRRIGTIIIDALDSQPRLVSRVHILNEVGEVVPTVAYSDPSTAIVVPSSNSRVHRSLSQSNPRVIKRCVLSTCPVKFSQQSFRPFLSQSAESIPFHGARLTSLSRCAVIMRDLSALSTDRAYQPVLFADASHILILARSGDC